MRTKIKLRQIVLLLLIVHPLSLLGAGFVWGGTSSGACSWSICAAALGLRAACRCTGQSVYLLNIFALLVRQRRENNGSSLET
jgi:hypothetical protein